MKTYGAASSAPPQRHRWWSRVAAVVAATLAIAMLVAVNPAPAEAATVDTNAWYVLVNRNSGKALDVSGVSTADGARVSKWTRSDGANQQWQFVDSGGGFYRLKARHSAKASCAWAPGTTSPIPTAWSWCSATRPSSRARPPSRIRCFASRHLTRCASLPGSR